MVEWKINGALMKGFPTIEEVEKANKEQLARWLSLSALRRDRSGAEGHEADR